VPEKSVTAVALAAAGREKSIQNAPALRHSSKR